jgi:hypothetical protein
MRPLTVTKTVLSVTAGGRNCRPAQALEAWKPL